MAKKNTTKKKRVTKKIPVESGAAQRCIKWLNTGLGAGLFYALSLAFVFSLNLAMPDFFIPEIVPSLLLLVWAVAKLLLAFALVCLYQATNYTKWAIAALLLAASAIMPYVLSGAETQTFVIGIEALAVTALSLSLFDLGRATHTELGVASGLIFLGVILQILQNPLMSYVGIVFLAIGFYLSLKRIWQGE